MPRLQVADLPYYKAFMTCSRARPPSMSGLSAIPISEVLAFCELGGIANPAQRLKYLDLIQELDQIHREAWAEKQPK